ncbi:MAG TPA: hypothetical protein VJN21_04840 [Candidatus Acidoferrales bacterium]|nr:hypothetical protein [Candidatus Acidoferrales bacterium]
MPLTTLAQFGPQIPASAGGQVPPTVPTSEAPASNVFEFGLSMGATYDSKLFVNSSTGSTSDIRYAVTPRFALTKSLPRLLLDLRYSPGLEVSEHRLYQSLFSNNFGGGITYTPTDRTAITARQQYNISTDPFNSLGGPIGPLGQSTFLPGFKETSLLSNATISHQFSQFNTLGIGGSFADRKYENSRQSQPTVNLIQSRIASGNAYFTHVNSPRNTIGLQYQGQALEFPQQNARTFIHAFSILDVITFSSHASLTLFGGPDYSLTSNQVEFSLGGIIIQIPLKKNSWSGAGGAIVSLRGERAAFTGEFSRGISEGGGLLGAVSMTSGRLDLVERLTKNWDIDMNGSGAESNLISASSSVTPQLLNYGGGASLRRALGRNVTFQFFYQRRNQSSSNFNGSFGNHNVGGASLDIHFLHPLGR